VVVLAGEQGAVDEDAGGVGRGACGVEGGAGQGLQVEAQAAVDPTKHREVVASGAGVLEQAPVLLGFDTRSPA
jgi:hypothetical protein